MQAGFITALVLPLWSHLLEPAFAQVMDVRAIVAGMRANLARYTELIEREKERAAREKAAAEAAAAAEASAKTPALTDAPAQQQPDST